MHSRHNYCTRGRGPDEFGKTVPILPATRSTNTQVCAQPKDCTNEGREVGAAPLVKPMKDGVISDGLDQRPQVAINGYYNHLSRTPSEQAGYEQTGSGLRIVDSSFLTSMMCIITCVLSLINFIVLCIVVVVLMVRK